MKIITSQALDLPPPAEVSVDTPLSERLWCCPRCKFHRCFVTTEAGPSSTIRYELVICDNCAHVEMRAAQLDVVASLAAGGEHGVRLVNYLRENEPVSVGTALDVRLPETDAEAAPHAETAGAVTMGPEVPPRPLHDFPRPLPITVTESLDRTAAVLKTKLSSARELPPGAGSARVLTILLVVSGLGAAAWLLFGRANEVDISVPTPAVVVSVAPVVPLSGLPGAPHAVDPGAIIEQARLVTGIGSTAILTEIDASFVGANGKVDLDNPHYKGRIVYHFAGRRDARGFSPRPEGVPLGAPGTGFPFSFVRFLRTVVVDGQGMMLSESYQWEDSTPGVSPKELPPRCSFYQIWEAARTGDAPADAVATMNYAVTQDRPAWWFQIENTSFGFSFNPATCTRY